MDRGIPLVSLGINIRRLSVEHVHFFEHLADLNARIVEWRERRQKKKLEDDERLWEKLRLEWNYNSNHIEGNTLTYHETELLLLFDCTAGGQPLRDYEEMKVHNVAIDHTRRLAGEERILGEGDIKDLNQILLKEPFWLSLLKLKPIYYKGLTNFGVVLFPPFFPPGRNGFPWLSLAVKGPGTDERTCRVQIAHAPEAASSTANRRQNTRYQKCLPACPRFQLREAVQSSIHTTSPDILFDAEKAKVRVTLWSSVTSEAVGSPRLPSYTQSR